MADFLDCFTSGSEEPNQTKFSIENRIERLEAAWNMAREQLKERETQVSTLTQEKAIAEEKLRQVGQEVCDLIAEKMFVDQQLRFATQKIAQLELQLMKTGRCDMGTQCELVLSKSVEQLKSSEMLAAKYSFALTAAQEQIQRLERQIGLMKEREMELVERAKVGETATFAATSKWRAMMNHNELLATQVLALKQYSREIDNNNNNNNRDKQANGLFILPDPLESALDISASSPLLYPFSKLPQQQQQQYRSVESNKDKSPSLKDIESLARIIFEDTREAVRKRR